MAFQLPDVLEWLKLSKRKLFAAIVVFGTCVLLPTPVLERLGLAALVSEHRPWLGGAFLVALALLLAEFVVDFWNWGRRKYQQRETLKTCKDNLTHLSEAEKKVLRKYLERNTKTIKLPMDSGLAAALVNAKIIYRASNFGDLIDGIDYNIQPWAWDYLHEHPELLQ